MAASRHINVSRIAAHLQELAFDVQTLHTDELRDAQSMRWTEEKWILTSGDHCSHGPESVTDVEKHTDGNLASSHTAHSTFAAPWCPWQLGLPCALAAPGAHGAHCPLALLGALPPLFGGDQLLSCAQSAPRQACMSAASFEQLQHPWSCHAAPACLWRCQP